MQLCGYAAFFAALFSQHTTGTASILLIVDLRQRSQ